MKRILIVGFLMISSIVFCIPIKPEKVKPDYKVIKYLYTRENETDVMDPEAPEFQIVPMDFLCEFCQVVIIKLKDRQLTESDFEQKIREECNNSTKTEESSLCDVINRVNLDKLRKEDSKKICEEQSMCNGLNTIPEFAGSDISENEKVQIVAGNKNVNASLLVEDIAPPYNS